MKTFFVLFMKQLFLFTLLFPALLFAQGRNFYAKAAFEENNGQVKSEMRSKHGAINPGIRFVLRGKALTYYFSDRGYSVVASQEGKTSRIDFFFQNNAVCTPVGVEKLAAENLHYTSSGILHVSRFNKIVYSNAWPGIDLEFSVDGDFIEKKVIISSQNFSGKIAFNMSGGIAQVNAETPGYSFAASPLFFSETIKPNSAFDVTVPQVPAYARMLFLSYYNVRSANTNETAASSSIAWLTYIGGTNSDELFGITLTNDSGVVITGRTASADFPSTPGSYQDTFALNYDAIATRFDKDGNCLWSTFYGGTNFDGAYQVITLDSTFVITGMTNSSDLPLLNPTQPVHGGSYDAFLMMLNDSGHLVRATYYGGTGSDQGIAIAKGNNGEIVLAGSSTSTNLPSAASGYQGTMAGMIDAFVARFDAAFNVQWSSYYGGSNVEDIHTITMTPQNEIAFAGATRSFDFPVTPNAWQSGLFNQPDNYIVKFSMTGTRLYATYFGGTNNEDANGIVGDGDGNLYLTGYTYSVDFPIMGNAFQTNILGQNDVYVSRFDSTGQLVWSTFVGGGSQDVAWGMYRLGKYLFICGQTESAAFPVNPNAIQPNYAATSDGFVIKMDTSGRMVSGTFMGGNGVDALLALVVDADTNVFACGNSYSTDLPVTANPFQPANAGSGDGYVVKFGMSEQLITAMLSSEEAHSLSIYPNPATDLITIELKNGNPVSRIEIFDASGRAVQQLNLQGQRISVNINDLPPGVYFMKVIDNNAQQHISRFVKE
jgi:hypothetical protein